MLRVSLVTLSILALPGLSSGGEKIDYLCEIKPIFARHCYACHGVLKQRSGLRLDTAAAMKRGGDGGAAIEPGKSGESLLIEKVTATDAAARMPPQDEGEALKPEEIVALKRWIDEGAAAPADEAPQTDPRQHWSFQRIQRPALPAVAGAVRIGNPIDAFISIQHEQHHLVPKPAASKEMLLRRVFLDLVGLPPTREELHAFLADGSSDAYDKVVDRLLESPQYGERWARHWMDIWRYSDWYGRRAVPDVWNSAPQIWRWRDWIVRSLNDDKGYDRMVMEMLAADEIAPEDEDAAVATGFIIRNWYALNPHQWMKDMVEHTGKAFLGLTLNCAHCHDHKYDPVSNEEYFRFRAFFEPVQVRQDRIQGEPDPGPFQKYEYTVLRKVVKPGLVRIFDENLAAETRIYRQGDERNVAEGKHPVAPGAPAFLGGDKLNVEPVELPAAVWYPGLKPFIQEAETESRAAAVRTAHGGFHNAQRALVAALEKSATVESQRLQALETAPVGGTVPPPVDPRLLDRVRESQTGAQNARSAVQLAEAQLASAQAHLESVTARIAADKVRYGTNPGNADELAKAASRGERTANLRAAEEKHLAAEQGFVAARFQVEAAGGMAKEPALSTFKTAEQRLAAAVQGLDAARKALEGDLSVYSPLSPVYPAKSSGRRRALAQWIASRDNPLTARVAVNHIWLRHFGRALVESPFDFGINGKKSTHPELLDWLAAELMESTETGSPTPPGPPLLRGGKGGWQMKHLHRLIVTSNTYRMSSAGGGENPNLAADPDNRWYWRMVPRRMEAEVLRDSLLHLAGQLDPVLGGPPLENDQELISRRRGLYFSVYPEGGGHPPMLELFDAPDPSDCYRRSESLVPQQALVMANGPLALNQSRLLGRKLWQEAAGRETAAACQSAFIVAAFEQVLSRGPSTAELTACCGFLEKQIQLFKAAAPATGPSQTPAAAAETVAASADPVVRAAENLVHALFNHNDFVTIR